MTKRVSSREARANFSELLGSVYHTKEPVIIERKGKPYAALVDIDSYREFDERDRQSFWATVEDLWAKNADQDPDEVYRIVTEIVEEVRQERYDERQRRKGAKLRYRHQRTRQRAAESTRSAGTGPAGLGSGRHRDDRNAHAS